MKKRMRNLINWLKFIKKKSMMKKKWKKGKMRFRIINYTNRRMFRKLMRITKKKIANLKVKFLIQQKKSQKLKIHNHLLILINKWQMNNLTKKKLLKK